MIVTLFPILISSQTLVSSNFAYCIFDMTPYESFLLTNNGSSNLKQLAKLVSTCSNYSIATELEMKVQS